MLSDGDVISTLYLWTDDGEEIHRWGARHKSFRIGDPTWRIAPFYSYLDPFPVGACAQWLERIAC